jgi:hypothetical protein
LYGKLPFLRPGNPARVLNHSFDRVIVDDPELAAMDFYATTCVRTRQDKVAFFAPRP